MIERLSVSNFKSFEKLDVSLGNLNVLIGANASGKTNFIRLLRFLKNIESSGLEDAIYKQGDTKYFLNLTLGVAQPFSFQTKFKYDTTFRLESIAIDDLIHPQMFHLEQVEYNFDLVFNPQNNFRILKDQFRFDGHIVFPPSKEKENCKLEISKSGGQIEFHSPTHPQFFNRITKINDELFTDSLWLDIHVFLPTSLNTFSTNKSISFDMFKGMFYGIGFYDFEPKRIKETVQSLGNGMLTESGDNFAAILERILSDDAKRREYLNLVSYALPFISELSITKNLLGQLSFTLRETHQSDVLPSELLSEGTLNVLALVAVLYFSSYDVLVIEEPERHIHPALLAGVMELVKEASERKQIILTTHHPEIVRHAGIENLLLVSRNTQGFSDISRPADSEDVKRFLQNELGIDYLYVQQLL